MDFGINRRWLLAGGLLVAVLAPTPALAHVKWFEPDHHYPVQLDLVWSQRTLLWLLTSLAAVGALYVVHRFAAARDWPWTPLLKNMAIGAPTLLAVQAAIGLVNNAVQPALLAPNLRLRPDGVGALLACIQLVIAMCFITGIADWLAELMLVGVVGATALVFSPGDALEQLFWAGIGLAVVVFGRGSHVGILPRPWSPRSNILWMHRAMVGLRVATGVSLVAVAFTEKLWNPALGNAFLADRPYLNVFQTLPGMAWFNNDAFVLCAGLTEAAIGAMLISGFGTRLVILAMWVPFNLSIPFLPPQELLGHLPILAVMYVLLVQENRIERVATPYIVSRLAEVGRIGLAATQATFIRPVSTAER